MIKSTTKETDSYIPLDQRSSRAMVMNQSNPVHPQKSPSLNTRSNSIENKSVLSFSPGNKKKKQSSFVTIFSIWNTMVGSSLLVSPWALQQSGVLGGIIVVFCMCGICMYTAYCNISVYKLHGEPNEEVFHLARKLLGKWAEIIAKVFSYIVLIGAIIIYFILLSNFLFNNVKFVYTLFSDDSNVESDDSQGVLDESVLCPSIKSDSSVNESTKIAFTKDSVFISSANEDSLFNKYWNDTSVPLILAFIVFPLLCFRSPTFFTKFTSLGVMSVIYILLYIFVKSANWKFFNTTFTDDKSVHYAELFSTQFPVLSGILALGMFIHNIIISIMKTNGNQEKNTRDLIIAFSMVGFTYLFIGLLFFFSFPISKKCMEDNLLVNFKVKDPLTVIARMFLFFQVITVYPLLAFMLRSQILSEITISQPPGRLISLVFNVIMVVICILFNIFLPHIGTVIRFAGSIAGFVHIFTLPCLLKMASLKLQTKLNPFWITLNTVIPILGGMNLVAQFFIKT